MSSHCWPAQSWCSAQYISLPYKHGKSTAFVSFILNVWLATITDGSRSNCCILTLERLESSFHSKLSYFSSYSALILEIFHCQFSPAPLFYLFECILVQFLLQVICITWSYFVIVELQEFGSRLFL